MEPTPAPAKHPTTDYLTVGHHADNKTWQWTRMDASDKVVSSSGTVFNTRKAAEAEGRELNPTVETVYYV